MSNKEPNETDHKRKKCQSIDSRIQNPSNINFQFRSSLFTEKNKSLIEKLISQNVSQESSLSKEEIKEKPKIKTKKAFSTIRAKLPKSLNNSLLENISKRNIKNAKIIQNKNMLTNKNNSTISIRINDTKSTITDCQIKPIHKKILKICKKPVPNLLQKKTPIQTVKNSVERKRIIFNGITKDLNKNKTRNVPNKQKPKQNTNLNTSVKSIYRRKKLESNNNVNEKSKIIKNKHLRNSVDNRFNYLNIITVNTIHLNERKKIMVINNNLKMKNKSKANNLFASPKYRRTIQYK